MRIALKKRERGGKKARLFAQIPSSFRPWSSSSPDTGEQTPEEEEEKKSSRQPRSIELLSIFLSEKKLTKHQPKETGIFFF